MTLQKLGYAALIAAVTVLAVGSAGPSEAKGKKMAQATTPPRQPICLMLDYHPVCALKGATRVTYANSCFAANDGARVVSDGACPAPKMAKKPAGKKAAKKKAM
ncbi:MAG: hypothetical protein IRY89_09980 [Pseudolabrys sp.]|nr:hypothetical protein [Pseudolabrys sp.]